MSKRVEDFVEGIVTEAKEEGSIHILRKGMHIGKGSE